MNFRADFLVIGSGISGLTYALQVAKHGKVIILTKKAAIDSSTNLAQGGIASAIGKHDSFNLHIRDTLRAGGGICNENVVNEVISSGPEQISKLLKIGVNFSRKKVTCNLDLGREGGHSQNRIVHAQDMTGQEIEKVLLNEVRKTDNITLLEEHIVIDLVVAQSKSIIKSQPIRCYGAYALDRKNKNIKLFLSHITIIASGGAGKIYIHSSNPDIATGDGIAMGYRVGANIANLEFVQFHPTGLYSPLAKGFLISEALRGDGAVLLNSNGILFMQKYDPLKDLACRDIVTRAIDTELKKTGENCVFLDISHKKSDFIKKRFPNLYKKCLQLGIDMTKEPIPVVPSAHYMCGGIITDMDGETSIKNLYAIGEAACTGLHGANRLASNSLLEALAYAEFASIKTIKKIEKIRRLDKELNLNILNINYYFKYIDSNKLTELSKKLRKIRQLMWDYVGIVRSNAGLLKAQKKLAVINLETKKVYPKSVISPYLIEFKNILLVSQLVVKSAILRKESRGLHYNVDYPSQNDTDWKIDTIIKK